jgi:hypothetical protein
MRLDGQIAFYHFCDQANPFVTAPRTCHFGNTMGVFVGIERGKEIYRIDIVSLPVVFEYRAGRAAMTDGLTFIEQTFCSIKMRTASLAGLGT